MIRYNNFVCIIIFLLFLSSLYFIWTLIVILDLLSIIYWSKFNLLQICHQHLLEFKLLAPVPDDPWTQLRMAMEAVFNSWFTPRCISYRDIHNIAGERESEWERERESVCVWESEGLCCVYVYVWVRDRKSVV